jgi:hypothetical protein
MRKQFVKTVESLVEIDTRAVVLLGDIGIFGFRNSFKNYPDRTYNIGILEQSTISLAAGLSIGSMIPIIHTNVGDNSLNFSKKEIANCIMNHVKFDLIDSALSDLDKRNFEISLDKINELGFYIKYTLEDGVDDLVKLYRYYVQYVPYKII